MRPRAVTQTQIGLAAESTLFIFVALVPASVSPVLREPQIPSKPPAARARRRGRCLLTPPQHPRDSVMDAGPMGGRSDTPTLLRTDPRVMKLLLGGAAPSGQAPCQADGWAASPATRTLMAVLQGQQGRLWGPSFSHSTSTGLAGGPTVCWNSEQTRQVRKAAVTLPCDRRGHGVVVGVEGASTRGTRLMDLMMVEAAAGGTGQK